MKRINRHLFVLALAGFLPAAALADEVTDWNAIMLQAAHDATPPTNPLVMSRVAAIVHASVFDAVNGIEGRYAPILVAPAAPPGASRRAAAVQAAYASLVLLYPLQTSTFDSKRAASLAAIPDGDPDLGGQSVARGIEWGQTVADGIWAWRSSDGFTPPPPPFVGGTAVGQWRPTPLGLLSGAGPQFATMTPWVIESPSQFRPAGPPDLAGARYAADFEETKSMGSLSSPLRSADQTLAAQFWNSTSATYLWNHVAVELSERHHLTLSENSRLFALLDLAMADAAIACWEAKYHFVFWRPVTAIPLADTDGNPATVADPGWTPLLATPNHPEYPSGHSTVSGAAAAVLAAFFGGGADFTMDSDFMPGVVRSFGSFSAALDEVLDARVFAGIHYRSACRDGQTTGILLAEHVLENALQRVRRAGRVIGDTFRHARDVDGPVRKE
jgi:hypothetical protein